VSEQFVSGMSAQYQAMFHMNEIIDER